MSPTASGQPAQAGERIGAYELLEKIEESASIVTFAGRDPLLGRRVVIRQAIAPSVGDGDTTAQPAALRARIEQYRGLARRHERIVNVVEVIDDPRGLFVVMEHVEGEPLDDRLNHGRPFAPMSVIRTLRSVAAALQPMHDQGMVHRDLRPGCLIVTPPGTVRIADFGLAGMVGDAEALSPVSVRYMAPELCRGEPGDARSDLYALGMIGYEMLIGRAAFEEAFSAVLRDTRHQAVRWVKWHTSLRNTAPPADEVNPAVPPILAQIVARLMEKDPAKRIASAKQLLETIERHFARDARPASAARTGVTPAPTDADVSTGGDTAALPPRSKGSRRPAALVAAAVALVLLVGGYFAYQSLTSGRAGVDDAAVRSLLRDAEQAYKSGTFAEAQALYERAAAEGTAGRLATIARAGSRRSEAHLLLAAGDFEGAQAAVDEAAAAGVFSREALHELSEEVASRRSARQAFDAIRAQIAAGEIDAARRALSDLRARAVTDADRTLADELALELEAGQTRRRVETALASADELAGAGDLDSAIALLTGEYESLRVPALRTRVDRLTAARRAGELLAQGQSAQDAGDWPGAIVAYSAAVKLTSDPEPADRLANAKMEAALADGRRLFDSGDRAGAAAAFTRALGYGDSTEARGYLARMEATDRTGALLAAGDEAMAGGEFAAAARHYAAALEVSPDHPDLPGKLAGAQMNGRLSAGREAMTRGDYAAAREAFERAAEIDPERAGAAADLLAELEKLVPLTEALERGDALLAAGRYTDAKRAYAEAKSIMDTPQVRARADDAEYEHLVAQARSFIAAKRWDGAEALLRNAARIHDTPLVRELIAQAAKERGDE